MEGVLSSPPLNNSHSKKPAKTITITKVLVGGDLVGPQVVVCIFSPEPRVRPIAAVAKIYDALYYRLSLRGGSGKNYFNEDDTLIDPAREADGEYSREAAAYERLRQYEKDTQGCIPKYYGSYTITHDLEPEHRKLPDITTRQVRLILLEYIHGISMEDLRAVPDMPNMIRDGIWKKIDEDNRMAIMARFLEARCRLQFARVDTLDDHPRNRMIFPIPATTDIPNRRSAQSYLQTGGSDYKPRAVLIDFGKSVVWSRSNDRELLEEEEEYKHDERPRNPLIYQWNEPRIVDDFQPWVADWYFKDDLKRHEWLRKMFIEDGEEKKYIKVNKELIPGKKVVWD